MYTNSRGKMLVAISWSYLKASLLQAVGYLVLSLSTFLVLILVYASGAANYVIAIVGILCLALATSCIYSIVKSAIKIYCLCFESDDYIHAYYSGLVERGVIRSST